MLSFTDTVDNLMLSGLLMDFGGTLDSDGGHWLDRFWAIYAQIGLTQFPKDRIKEAFYWADLQAETDAPMRSAGFRAMMERHVAWQFQKLGLTDPEKQAAAAAAFYRPSERILHRNRGILEKLSMAGYKMGVVSNFYGNVEVLCKEALLAPYLAPILDSAVVGLKKPDPAFFQMALNQLKLPADHVGFVGDSFERDMAPAKALGMRTYWMIGDTQKTPPQPGIVDVMLLSLEDLPAILQAERKP
jgi:putative hydrolase of the HAD superfamily